MISCHIKPFPTHIYYPSTNLKNKGPTIRPMHPVNTCIKKTSIFPCLHYQNMAKHSSSSAAITTFLPLVVVLTVLLLVVVPNAHAARAFFVFGDSLVDNGNNNYLITTARADSPPYGIDYPTGRPTGRFSNGFNIPDLISKQLILHVIFVTCHIMLLAYFNKLTVFIIANDP